MPVTPTGPLSLPLHYLRLTLADLASFRTWVGAADQAAALARVHLVACFTADTMPFAVVGWSEDLEFSAHAHGARNHADQRGSLMVTFRASIDEAHDEADAAYTFLNSLGDVLNDIWSLAGTAGYLDVDRVQLVELYRPEEDEKKTVGDFYQATFRVSYRSTVDGA